MRKRVPIWTIGVIGAAILAHCFTPVLAPALLQDRIAVQEGEWWRLLTGHFVHHSVSHLFWNIFMIGIAGGLLELRHRSAMAICLSTAGVLIGPGIHLCLADMRSYAGLSGIATALMTGLILLNLGHGGHWQIAFALLVLKLATDILLPNSRFVSFNSADIRTVPLAHALGAAAGCLTVYARRASTRRQPLHFRCIPLTKRRMNHRTVQQLQQPLV